MHTHLSFFVSAIGFGLAYSAAPGAVNTETIRRGVRHGYRPAVLVELGALIGDGFWAALALTGSAFLLRSPSIWLALGFVGAGFLLRLAWRALHEAWRGSVPRARGETARGNFSTGIVFSIANPFGLAFWSGVGTSLVATETGGTTPARFTLLLAGFLCGSLLWCLGFPLLIGWGRRYVGAGLFQIINGICGVARSRGKPFPALPKAVRGAERFRTPSRSGRGQGVGGVARHTPVQSSGRIRR